MYSIYPTPEPIVIPRPQTSRGSAAKPKKNDPTENVSSDSLADSATTNITIIQVSSASVKDKMDPKNGTSELPDLNFMNNVQIIPSNYSPSDQNAITTVQVTNETSTLSQIKDQVVAPVLTSKGSQPNSVESHDERQFGAVTNISIGASEKKDFQQEQLHYEQVFITHTPSGASISTGNSDDVQPKINRIKVDSAQRSIDDTEIRPSTSTASTVTFSVAAATGHIPDAINSNAKTKDTTKNRNVENSHDSDVLASRRPLLSRGVTEAVILRPSRKDVNMLLNRINPQANHVSCIVFNCILEERKNKHFSRCSFFSILYLK